MKDGKSFNNHSTSYTTIAKENRMWLNILIIGVVGAWFAAAVVSGLTGFFNEPGAPPLRVGLFLLVPILGFSSAYFLSSRFRRFAKSLNLELMTMSHLWRFVGLSFIYGYLMGFLPAAFALPAGIGDILVAATALPLARAIRNKSPQARANFIAWNIFGLADLLLAISLGILYSESAFGILARDVTTAAITAFPGNLVPTFFVPLFILLHLLALSRSAEVSSGDNDTSTRQNDGEVKQ